MRKRKQKRPATRQHELPGAAQQDPSTVSASPGETRQLTRPVHPAAAQHPAAHATGSPSAPELFRRTVLLLVTALIVARPLVLGEDPGLLDHLSDPGGLLLAFLWLVAALFWAVWRAWSGDTSWRGGLVELGLLGVVVVQFVSASVAAQYKHPAWLIAWEWLVLLVAFVLVRQLSASPLERRLLLAAVLATGVCVSVQALFEAVFKVPAMQAQFLANPEYLRQELLKIGEYLPPDDPRLEGYLRRIREGHVLATYAHPNSLAGYLALLLPVSCGFTVVAWRQQREAWQIGLLACCTALLAGALWYTHSRGALLAVLVAGGAAAAWAARDFLWQNRLQAGLTAGVVLAAVGVVLWSGSLDVATGKDTGSAGRRLDYWRSTWAMILDHPWLGVGPGNFGRHYPQYMRPVEYEYIKDPHNFALELWAVSGFGGMVALLVALGALYARTLRFASGTQREEPGSSPAAPERTPWEFYFGGMAGLLLAFVMRGWGQAPEALSDQVAGALLRAVVWFGIFALFASVPWSGPSLVLALTAGVSALLLNLLVSGGIAFPSVAGPLWLVAALALASTERETAVTPHTPRPVLLSLWPLPVALAIALAYFLLIFTPVTSCTAHRAQVRKARDMFRTTAKEKGEKAAEPLVNRMVAPPLEAAIKADPADVAPLLDRADWCLELAEFFRSLYRDNANDDFRGLRYATPAFDSLRQARTLDPLSKDALLREFQFYQRFAQRFEEKRDDHLKAAEAHIDVILKVDPREAARLHYQLAETFFALKKDEKGKDHARQALEHDQQGTSAAHRLTDRQREQARKWLGLPGGG